MTQWAYLPYFEEWEEYLPNASIQEFKESEWIELNSATLTMSEVTYIRKLHRLGKETPVCAYCHSHMKYDAGFTRPDGMQRAPSFKHYRRRNCFQYESLAHAATKKFIFSRLESAGYRVYESAYPLNGQKLHADVAAYKEKDKLRMVTEVLATPPRLDHMIRKMNTFAMEHAPTAWVLLLDSFFAHGVTGGVNYRQDMSKAGEITYKATPMETGTMDNFIVIGAESRVFSFLIDQYGYAIGIYQPGYVFLIKRDMANEETRQLRLLRGQSWDFGDDVFMITRIADKDIVPTLLHTPLLQFQHESITVTKLPPGIPKDLQESDHHLFDFENELSIEATIIDFEAHKLDGEEAELAYNPIDLIQESRQARETARRIYQEEKAAQQAEEAKREADEAEKSLQEERAQVRAEQALEVAKKVEEDARHAESKQKASFLQAQIDEAEKNITLQQKEEWPWTPTLHRMQIEQRELLQDEVLRRGFAILHPEQLDRSSEAEGLLVLSALRNNRLEDSPIQLVQTRESITAAYARLDHNSRLALEHYLYPDGLSEPWFFTMMTQQQKKDLSERKKKQAQERREAKYKQDRTLRQDQISLDFD